MNPQGTALNSEAALRNTATRIRNPPSFCQKRRTLAQECGVFFDPSPVLVSVAREKRLSLRQKQTKSGEDGVVFPRFRSIISVQEIIAPAFLRAFSKVLPAGKRLHKMNRAEPREARPAAANTPPPSRALGRTSSAWHRFVLKRSERSAVELER